jgi:hypothetical protein
MRVPRTRQAIVALGSLAVLLGSGGFLWARSSGVLGAPGGILTPGRTEASAEVIGYLCWLKSFEAERHKMQLNQTFSLAPLATTAAYADMLSEDAPPIVGPPELAVARRFEERVSPVVRGWGATQTAFERVPAPPECGPLAASYHGALGHARTGIGTIFEKTVTTIHGMARRKDHAPTLSWLEREKVEKNLSHSVDASFESAQRELRTLQGRYRLPAELDAAHFKILPG